MSLLVDSLKDRMLFAIPKKGKLGSTTLRRIKFQGLISKGSLILQVDCLKSASSSWQVSAEQFVSNTCFDLMS